MPNIRAFSLLIAIAAVTAVLALPAGASAKIVYSCGYNVCVVNDAGKKPTKLTRDGKKGKEYIYPAVSRNGKTLVVGRDSDLYVGLKGGKPVKRATTYWGMLAGFTRVRPDGNFYAYNEFAYTFPGPASHPYTGFQPATHKGKASADSSTQRAQASVGFTASGHLISVQRYGTEACAWVIATRDCEAGKGPIAVIPDSMSGAMFGPVFDTHPNGKLVVASIWQSNPGDVVKTLSSIALFDATSGALVRRLTTGTTEDFPSFSPDGSRVVYECGKGICVVPTKGGRAKVLVKRGGYPTWGKG